MINPTTFRKQNNLTFNTFNFANFVGSCHKILKLQIGHELTLVGTWKGGFLGVSLIYGSAFSWW